MLRKAKRPLTAVEIAERALKIGGYPVADNAALKAMVGPINGVLGRRPNHVERLPGRPAHWQWVPPKSGEERASAVEARP